MDKENIITLLTPKKIASMKRNELEIICKQLGLNSSQKNSVLQMNLAKYALKELSGCENDDISTDIKYDVSDNNNIHHESQIDTMSDDGYFDEIRKRFLPSLKDHEKEQLDIDKSPKATTLENINNKSRQIFLKKFGRGKNLIRTRPSRIPRLCQSTNMQSITTKNVISKLQEMGRLIGLKRKHMETNVVVKSSTRIYINQEEKRRRERKELLKRKQAARNG
nr:3797_t:CDS:2 [Entrophospora candida]